MDYGKYLYEQEKKERAAKKHQKQIVLKEVKFSVTVDEHGRTTLPWAELEAEATRQGLLAGRHLL